MLLFACAMAAEPAITEVAVGLAASGEAVFQDGLKRVYEDIGGSLGGELVVSARTRWPVEVTFEGGFRELEGIRAGGTAGTALWYAPVSALLSARYDAGQVALLAGAGPSWVLYGESTGEVIDTDRSDSGARPGVLFEASGRWHTDWVRPTLHHPDQGPRGVDVFVSLGYRYSDVNDAAREANTCMEAPCGIDMSAARVSAGLALRL
ncbi:MAG: hypothetical protein FJ102_10585 [Deltaproteobacteria bacterium]|nr:hypothetical protein [Deltaproteobacteria bacterium]